MIIKDNEQHNDKVYKTAARLAIFVICLIIGLVYLVIGGFV